MPESPHEVAARSVSCVVVYRVSVVRRFVYAIFYALSYIIHVPRTSERRTTVPRRKVTALFDPFVQAANDSDAELQS